MSFRAAHVIALLVSGVGVTQSDDRQNLLAALDAEMQRAEQEELKLLSPGHYERARRAHRKAAEDARRGRRIDGVEMTVEEAHQALKAGFDSAAVTRAAVSDALAVRSEVLQFRRLVTKSEFWRAMDELRKAGEKIERDDLKGARRHGQEAERYFRKAAIEYLKTDLLGDARQALGHSKGVLSKEEHKAAERKLKDIENRIKKLKDSEPFSVAEVVATTGEELMTLVPTATGF